MAKNLKTKSHKRPVGFQKPNRGNPLLTAQKAALEDKHRANLAWASAQYKAQLSILLQLAEDACLMATSEVRGLGPANAEALRTQFRETVNELSALLADDDDPEVIYSRTKIDQRLEQIEGKDKARPWEERLAWCFLSPEVK